MKTPGSIRNLSLYLQDKTLDHGAWYGRLKRGITPSDIDVVVNWGDIFLFVEFKRTGARFADLPTGQRRLLEGLVRMGKGKVFAACAKIQPEPDKPVNSLTDIQAFQVLTFNELSPVLPGSKWEEFVLAVQKLDKS